ncbi:MAG: 4-hydroxyphenylpyruvate dioxygenase [Gammaproteobacteria bacterium]|nr:4-hydroxyphenylpyruvate dioxygenase [Gammaproteobacteria bacterium]
MSNQRANPMGVDGFEFVEFAAPDPALLHALFKNLGFTAVAKHRSKNVTLYRQGDINFLVNEEPGSFASDFAAKHGPCACGFAIRVKDAAKAIALAREKNAEEITEKTGSIPFDVPMLAGIGGSVLYLVDEYGDKDVYAKDFEPLAGVDQHPKGYGLTFIDHLTHNVHFGNMEQWADFYEKLFNFREIRYFDIKGAQTGLVSKAMTAPDDMVRIPINESSDEKSQINEYLREYDGEGIQHIALFTDDIYKTIESIREHGVAFLDTPDTYYEMVPERIPEHGEDLPRMQENRILIDADPETKKQLLLQIFTQNCIGPIFFEIIQRKGNEGFGEGNFQALFESIERDQMKRGVL